MREFMKQNYYQVFYQGVFQDDHMQLSDVIDLIVNLEPYNKSCSHEEKLAKIAIEVQEVFGNGFK